MVLKRILKLFSRKHITFPDSAAGYPLASGTTTDRGRSAPRSVQTRSYRHYSIFIRIHSDLSEYLEVLTQQFL